VQARLGNLKNLRSAFDQTIEQAGYSLRGLAEGLNSLNADAEDLRKAMVSLQVAHMGGLIESRRLAEDDVSVIFDDLRRHINATKDQLAAFNEVLGGLGSLAGLAPVVITTLSRATARMWRDEGELAAMRDVWTRDAKVPETVSVVKSPPTPRTRMSASPLKIVWRRPAPAVSRDGAEPTEG
jgi:hypothetical protein